MDFATYKHLILTYRLCITHGVYGWNFDGYVFGNNLVTTGYRNMFGTRITSEDIKRINDYGKDLREKQYRNEMAYDECCIQAEKFMCELLAEYRN